MFHLKIPSCKYTNKLFFFVVGSLETYSQIPLSEQKAWLHIFLLFTGLCLASELKWEGRWVWAVLPVVLWAGCAYIREKDKEMLSCRGCR